METGLSDRENATALMSGWWRTRKGSLVGFGACVLGLSIAFGKILLDLGHLASSTELYSHIPLVPFISLYLAWLKGGELFKVPFGRSPVLMLVPLVLALGMLGTLWMVRGGGGQPAREDILFLAVSAYVLLIIAGGFLFLGRRVMEAIAFPAGLLFFLAPFPRAVEEAIEVFFQFTSAEAASLFFNLFGTPFFREGLIFRLPGIVLEVGRECSGIRSSLVLFITSLIAGHLFLRGLWKRALLAGFVVPLAILRNGFRIATIGLLCVHVDPGMINSWIHRKGGPVFFILSLVPFFALILLLRVGSKGKSRARDVKQARRLGQVHPTEGRCGDEILDEL